MAFTFFFRDIHVLDNIVEQFIPYVTGRSSIKIWDAGCAMGQEPYTLTILLAEAMTKYAYNNLRVIASDHDAPFEKIIKEAVYNYTELERIPEDLFAKYFQLPQYLHLLISSFLYQQLFQMDLSFQSPLF